MDNFAVAKHLQDAADRLEELAAICSKQRTLLDEWEDKLNAQDAALKRVRGVRKTPAFDAYGDKKYETVRADELEAALKGEGKCQHLSPIYNEATDALICADCGQRITKEEGK